MYESFLFSLTIARFIQARRGGWGHVPLLAVLFRDGAWEYAVLFCGLSTFKLPDGAHLNEYTVPGVMSTNALLFALGPRTLASLGFPYVSVRYAKRFR